MEIGERFKQIRLKNNLSQEKLARLFECDQRSIINYETGSKIPHYIVESILKNFPNDFLWFLTGQEIDNIKINEMNKELQKTRNSLELSEKQELIFLRQDFEKIKVENDTLKTENDTLKADNKALSMQIIRLEAQNELFREQNERLLSSVESGAKKYKPASSNRESSTTEPLRKDL